MAGRVNVPEAPSPSEGQSPARAGLLADVVERLCSAQDGLSRWPDAACQMLPSRDAVISVVEALRSLLFPGFFGDTDVDEENLPFHLGATLDRTARVLREQIRRGLCAVCGEPDPRRCSQCEDRASVLARQFLVRLPEVRRLLATDVQAAYEGDPAAKSHSEPILCYPGILAVTNYRLAHELSELGVPLLPRMITEHAHSITGIDIHPGARIGERFFIDHGTGVVVGETAIIGNRVRIYQGVTLGAKSFPLDEHGHPIKGIPRHPIIEDDVIIYSGATILGRVTIGARSVVGGNVWLTHGVPPDSRVSQVEVRETEFRGGGGI
ncbi:MAG: serine O-acetyltransferase EpsC [Bacteroidales bacterium]